MFVERKGSGANQNHNKTQDIFKRDGACIETWGDVQWGRDVVEHAIGQRKKQPGWHRIENRRPPEETKLAVGSENDLLQRIHFLVDLIDCRYAAPPQNCLILLALSKADDSPLKSLGSAYPAIR
jgi:hypothetical protein